MVTTFILIGLFIASIGVMIWRFEWVGLLSNVDQLRINNKKGLAGWAGKCLLVLAIFAGSTGGISWFIPTERGQLIACTTFILLSQFLMVIYLSGLQRYTK